MTKILPGLELPDEAVKRFWASVDVRGPEECWEWQGYRRNRYGSLWVAGRNEYTHRFSFMLHRGPIPDGFMVCHRCDNPPCCNPDHYFLGRSRENVHDALRKGRASAPPHRTGEAHPHASLTDVQVTDIRARWAAAPRNQRALAEEFGVSQSTIWRIVHHVTRATS